MVRGPIEESAVSSSARRIPPPPPRDPGGSGQLPFISDADFDAAIGTLISRIGEADREIPARLEKNVRDPFALLAQACVLGGGVDDLNRLDGSRSLAQAIASAIGGFHQNVLGAMPGWTEQDGLVDLFNEDDRIAAEVKNKHNTMNADTTKQVLDNISQFLRAKRWGSSGRGYLVTILPRRPGQKPAAVGERIERVDGRTFYAIASGVDDALDLVFAQLANRMQDHLSPDMSDKLDTEAIRFCHDLFQQVHLGR